jgi:hypothetical protein
MMTITAPGEKPREVQAPQSGLATLKVKGGELPPGVAAFCRSCRP